MALDNQTIDTPKLHAGARVADIGCGHEHSTLLMAEPFSNSRFLGIDTHPASIAAAQALARQAGPSDQVEFLLAMQRRRCRASST